ncbi:MAG: leucine-rich repeat domain-containing protein, partial [Kiritimatiellales bacterium]
MKFNGFLTAILLLLAISVAAQDVDYTYTTNADDTITIIKFTGSGGAPKIPGTINNRPVTSIGTNAFSYGQLSSVLIPDSVTNIESSAFCRCTELITITVNATNAFYSSAGGALFNKRQTGLIRYPAGKTGGCCTIPGGVTNIGDYAFFNCYGLT